MFDAAMIFMLRILNKCNIKKVYCIILSHSFHKAKMQ